MAWGKKLMLKKYKGFLPDAQAAPAWSGALPRPRAKTA